MYFRTLVNLHIFLLLTEDILIEDMASKNELVHYVAGIDKLTEASQVSEDGSTLLLQNTDSPLSQSDRSSETPVRDAEAASGEDDKVQHHLMTSGI